MESRGYRPTGAELIQIRPGQRGLVLNDTPETLPPEAARRFENWRVTGAGRVQHRAGQNPAVALPGTSAVHTIARLYQPSTKTYVGFLGKGTELLRGPSPTSFAAVYSAFSGDPLTLVPYRPAVSGDPWMIVGDRLGVGQVPPSGEPTWLGMPKPVVGPTTRIADILTTGICSFDGSNGASAWTLTAGVDESSPPLAAGAPTAADVTGLQGSCVEFTTFPGTAAKGYTSIMGLPRAMDLTTLQGGFRAAEDEDIVHLWMRVNRPGLVQEIRVYFVCASGFAPSVIPGQNDTFNTDAFVKTFVPSDLTGFVETQESGDAAAEATQSREALADYLRSRRRRNPKRGEDEDTGDTTAPDDPRGTRRDPSRGLSETLSPGRNTWTEFGTVGVPLRRRDFTRIGNTSGRGWDTITGIVVVVKTSANQSVKVAFDDWFLTGGYGLDVSELGTATYDYRYTHYHLDTGDEGNPCDEQAPASRLSPIRQRIAVQPAAPFAGPGHTRVRQRFYRRGGTLLDDWYYVGQNTSNGGEFVDALSDLEIAAAPTLELDNYMAVPTQDSTGATVLAQPIPALWGPFEGSLYGCGDPKRPGHLYRSKPGRPGSWPPANVVEVCSPSEELMHGGVYAGQAFVFSRRRLYSLVLSPATGQVSALDTPCQKGLAGRWAFDIGPDGIYFVSDDGIYVTNGGAAKELSADIRLLWTGQAQAPAAVTDGTDISGVFLPNETALRLTVAGEYLYFFYQGADGGYHTLVYHLRAGVWSRDVYEVPAACGYWDRENAELPVFLGSAEGQAARVFGLDAFTDAGTPVVGRLVTAPMTGGRPREEKQLGDLLIQGSRWGAAALTVTPILDGVPSTPRTLTGTSAEGQTEVIDFQDGDEQRFRTVALDISLERPNIQAPAELWQGLLTYYPLAEETYQRLGQWEPLGETGGYLMGVSLTADTRENRLTARDGGGNQRTVFVEYSRGGAGATLGPFTIDCSEGRRTVHLSWPGVRADQVRLLPQDDNPWLLYALRWQASPEPPRGTGWDSGEEVLGDQYYTGLDLVLDTHGVAAQLTVYVDGVLVYTDPNVTTPGKRFLHFTFGPGYGHIFQAVVSAGVSGTVTVYEHAWQVVGVPAEQANWNRNFELGGTLGDKLVKGVLLDCDTGGIPKTVEIQADGVLQRTITVTAAGRRVLHFSWPQFQGRVLRMLPIDTAQGRLFSAQWIFDEEPLGLARWETQGQDHGQREPHSVFELQVEYRAPQDVLLTLTGCNRDGTVIFEDTYPLLASATRRRVVVELVARRAMLWKYLFTSSQAFWLYREGSAVTVLPWTDAGTATTIPAPFGTDDLDKQRSLGNASGIASTPNNGRGQRA